MARVAFCAGLNHGLTTCLYDGSRALQALREGLVEESPCLLSQCAVAFGDANMRQTLTLSPEPMLGASLIVTSHRPQIVTGILYHVEESKEFLAAHLINDHLMSY